MSDIEFPKLIAAKIGHRGSPRVFRLVYTALGPRFETIGGLSKRHKPSELVVVEHYDNHPEAVEIIEKWKPTSTGNLRS